MAFYRLAVQYLFMANEGVTEESRLEVEPFNATQEQNDYEVRIFLPALFSQDVNFHLAL
jgi:hypothetical protein